MPIVVACRCGQKFQVQDSLAGRRISCSSCGSSIDVPGPAAYGPSYGWQPGTPTGYGAPQPMAGYGGYASPRRGMSVGAIVGLVVAGIGVVFLIGVVAVGFVAWRAFTAGSSLALQTEDYAAARSSFQTKLIRSGPAPQQWDPLRTPPGALRVNYSPSNLTLVAFVDQPRDAVKRPAVLLLHGGFAFGDGDWEMGQPYRDAGYVVMMPVLRGENGQPGNFTTFYDEVDDVLAAGAVLAQQPHVDGDRIFVAGHSAGATLATLAALASNKFRGAAAFSGTMDQSLLVRDEPGLCVFDKSNPREIEMRSAVAYATSFKCPARLYYGSQELWAAASTKETATRAQAKGIDVSAHVVPGDHFTSVAPAVRQSVTFFNSLNPGGVPLPQTATAPAISDPPSLPIRPYPTPDMLDRPPIPAPPSLPPPGYPGGLRVSGAVVVFEMKGYTGVGDATFVARRAPGHRLG